jgi:hypothetical protein
MGFEVKELNRDIRTSLGSSDIDVELEYQGRRIFVESKDYADINTLPLPNLRDQLSKAVEEAGRYTPKPDVAVWISQKPGEKLLRQLEIACEQRGVGLLTGNETEADGSTTHPTTRAWSRPAKSWYPNRGDDYKVEPCAMWPREE